MVKGPAQFLQTEDGLLWNSLTYMIPALFTLKGNRMIMLIIII